MKIITVFLLVVSLPSTVYAQDDLFSPYQISFGPSLSTLSDVDKKSFFGAEAMAGYWFKDDLLFEVGLSHYKLNVPKVDDLTPKIIRFKTMIPVSDYASLYIGGGAAYDDKSYPLLNLGVNYRINSNWHLDVGYQGIFGIDSISTDIYSFNASFVYRFSNKRKVAPVVEKKESEKVLNLVPEREQSIDFGVCSIKSKLYEVKEGDCVLRIAKRYNMTIDMFFSLNKSFKYRNVDLIYPGEYLKFEYIDVD